MQLTLIKNPDESKIVLYKITRIIYAETQNLSLRAIESLASMILNLCSQLKCNFADFIDNKNIFESLNKSSVRHKNLFVDADDKKFQICLRTALRMMNGQLPDCCSGAVRFHNIDSMPDWAVSLGYIAEVDDLLFYL